MHRLALLLAAMLVLAAGWPAGAAPAAADDALLDGTAETDPEALAELALERARLGARWLAANVRPDGSFNYVYEPERDEYATDEYSLPRHDSAIYGLCQVYAATGEPGLLGAAEEASRFIAAHSRPVAGRGRAVARGERASLGGQALAVVALSERRRVTGDGSYDGLLGELGAFLLSLEARDEPGRYYQAYDLRRGRVLPEERSTNFPGEALLALTRLARHSPDGPHLQAALRAADYLIHRRDGDLLARGSVPREEHWTTIALGELYRLRPDPAYAAVAYLEAESIARNQYRPEDGYPERIGASRLESPPSYLYTATRAEALVAAWDLASLLGDAEPAGRFATAARRSAQFQLRAQYTPEKVARFPRPDRLIGAWGRDAGHPEVRIDYVRHNISGLTGVWYLTKAGALPIR
jgi:hypothetical protein